MKSVSAVKVIFQKAISKPARKTNAQTLGAWGEDIAVQYLRTIGYKIIAHHWTARAAEIDIVAQDKDEYVFIEVKTRSSRAFGLPEDSIAGHKVHRLIRAVHLYRHKKHILDAPYRIDAIAIEKDLATGTYTLRHLKAIL